MDLNDRFAQLSRDEYLEMVVIAGRAIARVQAIKQEALARLHARALPVQLPVQVGPVTPVGSSPVGSSPVGSSPVDSSAARDSPTRLRAGG
jgi:hypothetical protein